jgi:hypothetical protein
MNIKQQQQFNLGKGKPVIGDEDGVFDWNTRVG